MIKPSDDLAKRLEEEVGAWILPLNTRGHDLILEAAGELHALKKIVDDPGLLRLHAVAIRQKRIEQLEGELAEAQAKIDRLMLEYCPDEMTTAQIENWAKHQKPVSTEDEAGRMK